MIELQALTGKNIQLMTRYSSNGLFGVLAPVNPGDIYLKLIPPTKEDILKFSQWVAVMGEILVCIADVHGIVNLDTIDEQKLKELRPTYPQINGPS